MKIAIFAHNTSTKYSGGRYHSWMMAEALSHAGHDVYYVTNNRPIFYNDFSKFPAHDKIVLCDGSDFYFNVPGGNFDVVFLIPKRDKKPSFYIKVMYFAMTRNARMVLLNFETPNWFNLLSPEPINSNLWKNWKRSSAMSSMILSSAKESLKFAEIYFDICPPETKFEYCYPSINSIVADSIREQKKEKRIILITRFKNSGHKGGFDTQKLFCDAMKGYTLVILLGSGNIPGDLLEKIHNKAKIFGIKLEVKYQLTDYEKFQEIKRASLMIFPSFFEGFGLPPVESLYCNTPCIVFDLPVYKEISGDNLIYVKRGNWLEFRKKIEKALNSETNYEYLKKKIFQVASFENYSKNIDSILKRLPQNLTIESPKKQYYSKTILLIQIALYNVIEAGYILANSIIDFLKAVYNSMLILIRPLVLRR